MTANTVICTVGTSLFFPNLNGLKEGDPDPVRAELGARYAAEDWPGVTEQLRQIPSHERVCGAEINSLTSLANRSFVAPNANLFFCHSATDEGRSIGEVLRQYYLAGGHIKVECCEVEDLQDQQPERFRTHGLRNLVKTICRILQDYGATHTGINATGGYKAQIALAVLVGQTIGVPVYYKHERFDEIITVPPMPVSLDFDLWMAASGLLYMLEDTADFVSAEELRELCPEPVDERLESLLDRVTIDDCEYWTLSPAGTLFHQTLSARFACDPEQFAPRAVSPDRKRPPHVENSGHMKAQSTMIRFLQRLTDEVPPVIQCSTTDINAKLPHRIQFRRGSHGVEGLYPCNEYTVRFRVESDAKTDREELGLVALLNRWSAEQQ